MEPIYPTKEEILNNPPTKSIKEDILILAEWKERYYTGWKDKDLTTKHNQLKDLINQLATYKSHPCNIEIRDETNYYEPDTQTICLSNNKPSIISTLHEFGHHLHGRSELKACSYSVWMYKTVFPLMFKKMVFDGHMVKTTQ